MIQLKDLFQDFLNFWDVAQGQDPEKQLRLWQELYESKHPEVFGVYFSQPYWGQRENLSEAMQRYAKDVEKIAKVAEKTGDLIPKIVERALTAFATDEDEIEIDVIAFVGLYGADGFVLPFEGRPTVFLALESFAEYELEQTKVLIAHELSHGFHMGLDKRANPRTFAKIVGNLEEFMSWIAWNVFLEGVGTCASKRIVPGLEERAYLFYGPEQWDWCRRNEQRLIGMMLEKLDNKDEDISSKFFAIWRPTEELPYHRTGYYVGWLVIEQLLKQYSLRELAEMEPEGFPKLVREALIKSE